MNRRRFFGRLIGATIAARLAPSLIDDGPKVSLNGQPVGRPFAGAFTVPNATGTTTVTGVPFQPTAIIFARPSELTLESMNADGFTVSTDGLGGNMFYVAYPAR